MTVPVHPVPLAARVRAWFTGRDTDGPAPPIGQAGNLSARRPHDPASLARARREAAEAMGITVDQMRWMRQVHGDRVGRVTSLHPPGAEVRGVDALVTDQPAVVLVVQVADCVPVLLARPGAVAVAHAGRRGVEVDIVGRTVEQLMGAGSATDVGVVIGPAIGGCCYEVPEHVQQATAGRLPTAAAATTWGTPSLDLPAAVEERLRQLGVTRISRWGGCTRCDEQQRWFSHRADPDAGRQIGAVVLEGPA